MKRNLICYAIPILVSVALLALPDTSAAAAMKSAGSRGGSSYPIYNTRFAGDEEYDYGASEQVAGNTVLINVRVPAQAQLWFDGTKTMQTGSWRSFVTPALEPGRDYSYEIRARWTEGGRLVEHTRKINIRAGDRETLNFTARLTQ